ADAALLLIVATIGIVWRMHETSEVPAVIACQALAFYAVARMLDHPVSGAATLGVAVGLSFLARGWLGCLPLILAVPLIFLPGRALAAERRWLAVSALIAITLILLWWIPDLAAGPAGAVALARLVPRPAHRHPAGLRRGGAADPAGQCRPLRTRIQHPGRALRRPGGLRPADPAARRDQYPGLVRGDVLFTDGRHRVAGLGGPAGRLARPDRRQHHPPDPGLRPPRRLARHGLRRPRHPGLDRPGALAPAQPSGRPVARHGALGRGPDHHLAAAGHTVDARARLRAQLPRRLGIPGIGPGTAPPARRMHPHPGPGQRPACLVPGIQRHRVQLRRRLPAAAAAGQPSQPAIGPGLAGGPSRPLGRPPRTRPPRDVPPAAPEALGFSPQAPAFR